MDIVYGTDGQEALRDFLSVGDAVPDETLLSCWNAAVDATDGWIKDPYYTDAPAAVIEFVLNVAASIYRVRDTGGDMQSVPDGVWSASSSWTRNTIKRYVSMGGKYVRTPRTVA